MNPVDDSKVTGPLVKALQRHVDACAASLTGLPEGRRHTVAATWVYLSAVVAWAEDHGLVDPWLRKEAAEARDAVTGKPDGARVWLWYAVMSLAVHPATRCLVDARYTPLGEGVPGEDACQALIAWWSDEAPSLAYEVEEGPASITGWVVGDLLQSVTNERRLGNALCQTPWWVCDFMLDRTLVPAAGTFQGRPLRVIDPACGTGHLLMWATLGLHALYTAGVPGWPPLTSEQAVRQILDGVHGVELDPLTAAVARLRLTVITGAMLHDPTCGPLRLDAIPAWVRPRVAVGNALLASQGDPCPPGTILDDTADYPGILDRGTYHVVIGNPPYIVAKDKIVRDAVRAAYPEVCHLESPLYVPFTKLMFDLAIRGGGEVATVPPVEQLDLFAHLEAA